MIPIHGHKGFASKALSLVTLGVATLLLSGCNERAIGEVLGAIALALLVIVVVQLVVWAGLVALLVVNLVRLGRDKPSLGWGVAALTAGTFTVLPSVPGLFVFRFGSLAELALSFGLCFFGYKNVAGARELERWKRLGERDA